MKVNRVLILGLYATILIVNNVQSATCYGDYPKSCGSNCCYRSENEGKDIIIKDGSTDIRSNVFSGNKIIKNIDIPQSVESIGSNAFWNSSIENINIENETLKINSDTFNGSKANITFNNLIYSCGADCVVSLDSDGHSTVSGHGVYNGAGSSSLAGLDTKITSLTIGEGFTQIATNALQSKTYLTSIELPSTLAEIGSNAFWNSGIENIIFNNNDSIKTYGYTFNGSKVKIVYCSELALEKIGNVCSDNFNVNKIGKFVDNVANKSRTFYNPDGNGGFFISYRVFSNGVEDYYKDGQLLFRIGTDGRKYTLVKDGNYYRMYDAVTGNYISYIKADSPFNVRRIYTVDEAIAALGNNNRNTFSIRYR